jgi:2-oxoglutarate ferredoxin oxidoreductase subunit alpha
MAKVFIKGNEAAAEAAIRAGCKGFFFYPVTPSSEIGEYMSQYLNDRGGVFVQAESELSAINMMLGAAATGARVMTGTSGVGFSLMTEGLSYMAGCEVPAVVVDVMRAGPGLGGLAPTQADYNQMTKAPGHGGHMMPVYAPSCGQEIVDHVRDAFEIAEKYKTPVGILYDGFTGQLMESVEFFEAFKKEPDFDWALDDKKGRGNRIIRSGYGVKIDGHIKDLYGKYDKMKAELQRWEEIETDDAEIILTAFGILGRIGKTAVKKARQEGIKLGLIRPVCISPFPVKAYQKFAGKDIPILVIEMNYGLMRDDVVLAVGESRNVHFYLLFTR